MIHTVHLKNFKKFSDSVIKLHPNNITFAAGANNSGKSTLLQALAVWEFCKIVLQNEKGIESLLSGYSGQGLGISDDEFSPISIATLKHLWTNLKSQLPGKDGYSLSIQCDWSDASGKLKHLKISLALTNDRLFIKSENSNLSREDQIPTIAYLPTFAGIASRENKMSVAERRGMIGRGLAGGIIRNLLLDMHNDNINTRSMKRGERSKIKSSDLKIIRNSDPWEILQVTLGNLFSMNLIVDHFNDLFHTYIKIYSVKGKQEGYSFKKYSGYTPRDLMAEGSGFLQWLSVYVLALSQSNNILLLDEPDAHLHPLLQDQLINALAEIGSKSEKQIIMATHSTEILRWAESTKVLSFSNKTPKYLVDDNGKLSLFIGLGSEYSPKIDPLKKNKRMLIVENNSDFRILKIFSEILEVKWPSNLVVWPWNGGNKERKQLFIQLKKEIPDLKAIGIRDRDDLELAQVDPISLEDGSFSGKEPDMSLKTWRRRQIEGYIIYPPAIARAGGCDESEIISAMAAQALVIPDDFKSRDVASAILDARAKEIMEEVDNNINKLFKVDKFKVVSNFKKDEVPEDVSYLINEIVNMCN
ncbi:hypothetical protein EOD42_05560 [Rhodovarius crocodyli]|uniref:Uncharacterized protein n=1 Tax=Rhodovarius crocodyli TaxID=1979269 RepID=A0A437MPH5_9PROT|nr:AAA family ATPase [Rhodovarius crocodyli]RVT99550.1 hypothetical protein EOD42_05560 [Rhodovarius crocodyli]